MTLSQMNSLDYNKVRVMSIQLHGLIGLAL